MSRIVDKDLLISGMVDGLLDLPGKTYRAVREYIEGFPETVTHAHWINVTIPQNDYVSDDGEFHPLQKTQCSLCRRYNKNYKPPYCPHCGARMDEEE